MCAGDVAYFEYLGIKLYLGNYKITPYKWFESNEFWKDVIGFEGYYQVSTKGRVKSIYRKVKRKDNWLSIPEKYRTGVFNHKGYLIINLHRENSKTGKGIHRWLALSFIPNPLNLPEVNHKNGNKVHNYLSNLE